MPQIFDKRTSFLFRLTLAGLAVVALGGLWTLGMLNRSSYWTKRGRIRMQPVPFSHKHHAGELGIDCRYCHANVENSSYAGMPSTDVCMTCHSQLWSDAPVLSNVQTSLCQNRPIRWTRVNDLPDFVYFDHSVHVRKGVACVTCHGPVSEMPMTWQGQSLQMGWCLNCHRHPERYVGRPDTVFLTEAQLRDLKNRPDRWAQSRAAGGGALLAGAAQTSGDEQRVSKTDAAAIPDDAAHAGLLQDSLKRGGPAVKPFTDCSTCHR